MNCLQVSVVNFAAAWGNLEHNLNRMLETIRAAARQGSRLVLFPEMALTGYGYIQQEGEPMQHCLAQPVPGPAANTVAKLARDLGAYVVFGMPRRQGQAVYSSIIFCGPQGPPQYYDKLHLTREEALWATPGGALPPVIETHFGPVMALPGHEVLYFPEMVRYAKAKGVRLLLNSAALHEAGMEDAYNTLLRRHVGLNTLPIATAGLTGRDPAHRYLGGSHILLPAEPIEQARVAAGLPPGRPGARAEALHTAVVDMEAACNMPHYPYFEHNPRVGTPDWRPALYLRMTEEVLALPAWAHCREVPITTGKEQET